MDNQQSRGRFAFKVAIIHLGINLLIAALVAALVFWVWYPFPYTELMGGLHLLGIIVAVDVVCGPVLTSVLANPRKPKREMVMDFSLVAVIQMAALIYGLYAVAAARPVVVAFEADRFVAISAAELDPNELNKAPEALKKLSWTGVKRIAIRPPKDAEEKLRSLELSLQGIEPSMRPDWWQVENEHTRQAIQKIMRPISVLQAHYPNQTDLKQAIEKTGLSEKELYFLPFTSAKNKEWTVLLNKNTDFVGFVALDAFIK